MKLLKQITTPYIESSTLLNLLIDYQQPRECISRMVKNKELVRLKNGFFLISEKIESGIPYEQIANLLYGPSYLSLEWALSFYGMIPERVHTITSMTLGRDKEYHTPVGSFMYRRLSSTSYPLGIMQKQNSTGGFLIACPEKALADLVYITCRGMNKKQLMEELLESKRMDEEALSHLNKELLNEITQSYHSKSVHYLADIIGRI